MGDDTPIGYIKRAISGGGSSNTNEMIKRTTAAAENARAQDTATAVAKEDKKVADTAFAEAEKKRMAFGAGARTLLTGPAGLESADDEEGYSLARKQLKGM